MICHHIIEECISEGKHGFLVIDIEGFLFACVGNATFARNEGLVKIRVS